MRISSDIFFFFIGFSFQVCFFSSMFFSRDEEYMIFFLLEMQIVSELLVINCQQKGN